MGHQAEAEKLVLGDRNADYGNPEDAYSGLAKAWSGAILHHLKPGHELSAVEATIMMVILKCCRHVRKPKDDNLVDSHGYLLCAEWIETGKRPERLSGLELDQYELSALELGAFVRKAGIIR